ncbi:MAG TPA: lmo0937 family membrane protein [Clostridiales bacterium]|nr:lmo0937 family membrane protein [Clostridiales bacterium]
MLWLIATVLIILWLLGVITSYTIGGFIHIILVIAVIVILIKLIKGKNIFY